MKRVDENNGESRCIKYLDRGMTRDEVKTLLAAPMNNRERCFYRAIYETFYRVNELLMCDIEDFNKDTGELIARYTKNKYNPKTKKRIKSPPKHAIVSEATGLLLKRIISNRKKGAVFINAKGERLSKTYFQMHIHELAKSLAIQKVTHVTSTNKKYHLVTLKALREAGERHMDLAGADLQVTARGAQHSALIKEKYYKKSSWEEFQEQQRKYHPAFAES